jgi:hypothetical protein
MSLRETGKRIANTQDSHFLREEQSGNRDVKENWIKTGSFLLGKKIAHLYTYGIDPVTREKLIKQERSALIL